MALPSFTITGTIFDLLGNTLSGEIMGNGLSGDNAMPALVTFTSNVPPDQLVRWDGDGSLNRVKVVVAEVNSDGTITRNGDPVQLLANDGGLSVDGLQWQVYAGSTARFWFNAPTDGGSVDLGSVAPTPGVGVSGVAFSEGELVTLIANTGSSIREALDALYETAGAVAWADVTGVPTPLTTGGNTAGGYPILDGAGKIGTSQLPISAMEYKGLWNASTNSPTLADGTGNTGDFYRVGTAGSRNLGSGSITFDVGDYVLYNGSTWEKLDATDAVTSVAGLAGVITASALKTALAISTSDVSGMAQRVVVMTYSGSLSDARPTADVVVWSGYPSKPTNAQSQDIVGRATNYTATATAAGVTALDSSSTETQEFTGTTTQTVTLPTTAILSGAVYRIINNSSGIVTVNSSSGALVVALNPGWAITLVTKQATPTTAAHWQALNYFPTATSAISGAPSAFSIANRDANGDLYANAFVPAVTFIATAAGTTALTAASAQTQGFFGSTTQTITLPTTGIFGGQSQTIVNLSTGALTVNASGGALVATVAPGSAIEVMATQATPTLASHWVIVRGTAISAVQQAALDLKSNLSLSLNAQTASYTLVLADAGKEVEISNASANTLTVPPNSSVAFPIGTVIEFTQMGAGQTTITAGAGVTLRSRGAALKANAQYSVAALRKRATDEWVITGDLTT